MTPEQLSLNEALPIASNKLGQITKTGRFPELQASLDGILKAVNDLQSNKIIVDDESVRNASESVTRLYRISMAQANATPQEYQQPIFQCYGDYEKCLAKQTSASGKALCVTLFVLSLADNLLSLSISS